MMEKQVVGERASEYLDGKASSKAGPSMRDLPQIVVFLSTPSRTFCPAMPSYFRRWPMAACGCDCGSMGLSMIGDPAKGMLLYSAFGLVAQATSMIGPRFPLPPHRGPSSDDLMRLMLRLRSEPGAACRRALQKLCFPCCILLLRSSKRPVGQMHGGLH